MSGIAEIAKAIDGLNSTFHQFKEANDARLAEIEKKGEASAELDAQVKKMAEAMHEFEKKAYRPPAPGASETKETEQDMEHKAAFEKFARKGDARLTPDEIKLLSSSDDTQAGYLASRQMVNEVIKDITEISQMRTIARVIPSSKKGIEIPKRTGTPTAQWAGDGVDTTATNSTYGLETIDADELVAVTDVAASMLEDSDFPLAAFLQEDMAEQFAYAEGLAFVNGNGVKKPQGLLTATGLVEKANGHASALQADGIIALTFGIKTAYANNGSFVLNRNTLFAIYTLKDGQGQYLYRPNQEVGRAPTIQGRPYLELPDMPDVAANAYPIAYGDFRRGYWIADRQQVQVLRDEFSQSSKRIVRFVGSKRTGGQVVLPAAFAKLKIATSV